MRCFCLITKSFWDFFASSLGPDSAINWHNWHCSVWRWYHTSARSLSVFCHENTSPEVRESDMHRFFAAKLYTRSVRVTLPPIPPSFLIIPSLRQGDVHQFGARFRATHNVKPWKFHWELTYPLPMALLSRWFPFSQGGICWFPGGYINVIFWRWFLVPAHYFRYARRLFYTLLNLQPQNTLAWIKWYSISQARQYHVLLYFRVSALWCKDSCAAWHINHSQVHISHSPGALIP